MLEVEVKFKIRDNGEFEENLKKLGANYETDIEHTDTYYNLPEGLRNFAKTDEALRLRRIREFDIRIQETIQETISADLTYKGPKIDTETKTRKEIVTPIEDPIAMEGILQSLGFRPILTLGKNRRLYSIMRENFHIEILIDKIDHLPGYFSEFEILASDKDEMDKGKKIIFDLMEEIGYSKEDSILTSYLELVYSKLVEKGLLNPKDIT